MLFNAFCQNPFIFNNQITSMTDNICHCHCGTRITIDEQLIEEREAWREKYLCLQKQAANDIGHLKENIYAECATLMQKQFTERENQQNRIVNQKHVEIKSLTSRVINLETKVKILEKENEILNQKNKELQQQINEHENLTSNLKARSAKTDREWETKLEEDLASLRKKISLQYDEQLKKIETENQHLKHKVKQFQKKYQLIIPEVEKIKNALNIKTEQADNLQAKLQKMKKDNEKQMFKLAEQREEAIKNHSTCRVTITKLTQRAEGLGNEVEKLKKIKKEVKVQPVYIERPVEVQKIVEKIVEVQKIVKQYIEPTSFRDEELEDENKKLKEDINNLIRELHHIEEKFKEAIHDYEDSIRTHQDNALKYKKERETLAKTIEEQNREIDTIHSYLHKKKSEVRLSQPEKIVVHVSKDGTYQKHVEKIGSIPTNNSGKGTTNNKKK